MSNVEINVLLAGGHEYKFFNKDESCCELVKAMTNNDTRPPAKVVYINIMTESGKEVIVSIPNDQQGLASVSIGGENL